MEKSKAGRYIRETSLQALRALKPLDYMRYVDEEGKSIWMAACPKTWPTGEAVIVNLRSYDPVLIGDKLTCQKRIKAGFETRQSYVWTGTLKKGVWSWEE